MTTIPGTTASVGFFNPVDGSSLNALSNSNLAAVNAFNELQESVLSSNQAMRSVLSVFATVLASFYATRQSLSEELDTLDQQLTAAEQNLNNELIPALNNAEQLRDAKQVELDAELAKEEPDPDIVQTLSDELQQLEGDVVTASSAVVTAESAIAQIVNSIANTTVELDSVILSSSLLGKALVELGSQFDRANADQETVRKVDDALIAIAREIPRESDQRLSEARDVQLEAERLDLSNVVLAKVIEEIVSETIDGRDLETVNPVQIDVASISAILERLTGAGATAQSAENGNSLSSELVTRLEPDDLAVIADTVAFAVLQQEIIALRRETYALENLLSATVLPTVIQTTPLQQAQINPLALSERGRSDKDIPTEGPRLAEDGSPVQIAQNTIFPAPLSSDERRGRIDTLRPLIDLKTEQLSEIGARLERQSGLQLDPRSTVFDVSTDRESDLSQTDRFSPDNTLGQPDSDAQPRVRITL
ncbi:MAG: hypothetical protein KTR19_00610 [Hyphomicrobiales bacterium]|nr:hypothetical protein [Hyphomicrobiales bacterium]